MSQPRLSFIDWMKCLGLALIVLGHVGSPVVAGLTPPFNPKQLGVAFFLFAGGFSLARETRPTRQVLFNRLFEVFLFGIAFAILMSAVTYARSSRPALSNYLPFFLGSNVLFNHFPANPTTWFIGTYLHLLLAWALLRNWRVGRVGVLLVAVGEILIRAALMKGMGLFVAYMLLPNWATVFLLGIRQGQQPEAPSRDGFLPALAGLGVFVGAWALISGTWPIEPDFPFGLFLVGPEPVNLLFTSGCITLVYSVTTWLVYRGTGPLPSPAVVRFFARNTLLVFIIHMPVYYGLASYLQGSTSRPWLRVVVLFVLCYAGLAVLSEFVCILVRPRALRGWVWTRLNSSASAATGTDSLSRDVALEKVEMR